MTRFAATCYNGGKPEVAGRRGIAAGRSPNEPDLDWLVNGDPRHPFEAEEMWTYVRRRSGQWLLSAIQQI